MMTSIHDGHSFSGELQKSTIPYHISQMTFGLYSIYLVAPVTQFVERPFPNFKLDIHRASCFPLFAHGSHVPFHRDYYCCS